jgi:hypothetical protein
VLGIVCVVCLGGKRVELYRILVVEMNDWRWTNVGRGVAIVGETDRVIATCSSIVSLK